MTTENKIIFLLGGHDLEMVEIRSMLENAEFKDGKENLVNNLLYFDNDLSWGAKWSDYNEVLTDTRFNEYIIYGVELTEDIPLKENWKVVDHHNDLPAVPTSIEQIAKLLNIQLSRWQELVAANDHGYKGAMREIGASEAEIQEVRFLDRRAQGVTDEMEQMAQNAIQNATVNKEIIIIKTDLHKFSPIVDRLDNEKVLIYNNNSLSYYGKNADKIANKYHQLITENKAYSGGGKAGFFGLASGMFSEVELKNKFIMEILEVN